MKAQSVKADERPLKRILIAVDPDAESELFSNAANVLHNLFGKRCEISPEPVHVVAPDDESIYGKEEFLESSPLPTVDIPETGSNLGPIRALVSPSGKSKGRVERLCAYADECKPDLIVASSHGRKFPQRLFHGGSFAEGLLKVCHVPLLVINPRVSSNVQYRRLLFATDFKAHSEMAFRATLNLAHETGLEILIYSKLDYMAGEKEKYLEEPVFIQAREKDTKDRQATADVWRKWGEEASVVCDTLIDDSEEFLVPAIIRQLERSPGSIVTVVCRHGPVASSLGDGITRQLFRKAPSPVLAFPQGYFVSREKTAA